MSAASSANLPSASGNGNYGSAGNNVQSLVKGMGGAAVGGAVTGALAGSVVPVVGNIIGAIAGAAIGGIFDAVQGNKNRKAAEKAQNEAREMSERQFAWGQRIDQFGMDMADKTYRHQVTQDSVNQINNALKTNVGLQDRMRSMFGRRQ